MADIINTTSKDWERAIGEVFGCMDYAREHGPMKTMQKIRDDQDATIKAIGKASQESRLHVKLVGETALPKGWMLLPDSATITMHNAAAFGSLYAPPSICYDDDGYLRLNHRCPDWSRVYRVMVDAAPRYFNVPHDISVTTDVSTQPQNGT